MRRSNRRREIRQNGPVFSTEYSSASKCESVVKHLTMFSYHLIVLLCLWAIALALAKPTATSNEPQNSCPELDSCSYLRSGSRELHSARERNCACDFMCAEFGDCCADATALQTFQHSEHQNLWKCNWLRQFGGVYMKDTCSLSFSGAPEVQDLCENSNGDDFSDPLGSMPATNAYTGSTYKNYYCGICNEDSSNLVLWTPRLECPTLNIYNNSRKNLTSDFVSQNLVSEGTSWGLYLDGDNGSLFFHDCDIDPVMPHLLENKIRLCKSQLVSECAEDWTDNEVREKCSSYMGIRYLQSEGYRNIHCAQCNHINVSLMSCQSVEYRETIFFRTFEHRAFSLLLDINENWGEHVGAIQRCNKGEVFDPFFKKCRSLSCLPGHSREGNQCVLSNPPKETATEKSVHPMTLTTIEKLATTATSSIPSELGGAKVNDTDLNDPVIDTSTNITDTEIFEMETSTFSERNKSDLFDNSENFTVITFNTSNIDTDSPLLNEVNRLKNCLLISLAKEDFVLFKNNSLYVAKYDKVYEPTNYFARDGSVLVCIHFNSTEERKFLPLMGYVTVIGLGTSMLCLSLHFIVFCIVPDLRNLSGKNLLSQCFSLFFAYSCFILGQMDSLSYSSCAVIAFLTFFFFQVSFFWMSTMAFDVWRTLKMATTELRVTTGRQCKRFTLYSLYSWMTPLIIITIAAVAEYTDLVPEQYRPGFVQPYCWFGNRRALLVFFASPLLAIMLANIILFVSSARMIIMTTKTTTKQQNQSQRRNFKLYLRLALLMGLTWAIGLVAGYADSEIMWYVFIILNSLQGLFIFIAFSCSTKVFNCLKSRFATHAKVTEYRSSTLHSASGSGCTTNSTNLHSSSILKSSSKLLPHMGKHSASPTNSCTSTNSSRADSAYF